MIVLGYVLFFLILLAGPLLMFVALPVFVPIGILLNMLPPRRSFRAQKVYHGLFGGINGGLFIFGDAFLISSIFHCSYNWLIALGIGMLLSLLAPSQVNGAHHAIPAAVVAVLIVLGLSYWLVW